MVKRRQVYITDHVVRHLLGLAPVKTGVPELITAANNVTRGVIKKAAKKKGCGKCGDRHARRPRTPSMSREAAALISGLSHDKKLILLNALGTDELCGYLPTGRRYRPVILARRT